MQFALFYIAILSVTVNCTAFQGCTALEQAEIQSVVNLIGSYDWQNKMKSLDTGRGPVVSRLIRKNRIGREYDEITWVCNGRLLASRDGCEGNITGKTRTYFGFKILLCTNSMKKFQYKYCNLVEVMTHEFAHHIGVGSAKGHVDGPNGDAVYRWGYAMSDFCVVEGRQRLLDW